MTNISLLSGVDDELEAPPKRKAYPFVDDALAVIFGMESTLRELILQDTIPRCQNCGGEGRRLSVDDELLVDGEGTYIASLPSVEFGDLSEWLLLFEALGVEWALTEGNLVQIADLQSCIGVHPVVFLSTKESTFEFKGKVREWLISHGGSLTISHLKTRNQPAITIAVVTHSPRCRECCCEISSVLPAELKVGESESCEDCGGKGWIAGDSPFCQLRECVRCGTTGLPDRLARGRVGNVEIRAIPYMTFAELKGLKLPSSSSLLSVIDLIAIEFPALLLGTRLAWLSSGERSRIHLLLLSFMKVTDLDLALWHHDSLVGSAKNAISAIEALGCHVTFVGESKAGEPKLTSESLESRTGISIRNFKRGPFSNFEIHFPVARMSLIVGPTSAGKTTLLRHGIYSGFATRKKNSLLVSYPKIKSVFFVSGGYRPSKQRNLIAVSGMQELLAKLYSETRDARLSGLKLESFLGKRVEHNCPSCTGVDAGGPSVDVCESCNGTRLAPMVRDICFGSTSYERLLTMKLIDVSEVGWIPRGLQIFSSLAESIGFGDSNLSSSTVNIDSAELGSLQVFGQVAKVFKFEDRLGGSRNGKAVSLVVADSVFERILPEARPELAAIFAELVEQGHTVIGAERECPVELLSYKPYVIRLGIQPSSPSIGASMVALRSEIIHYHVTA